MHIVIIYSLWSGNTA